jgi:hypothetical protein
MAALLALQWWVDERALRDSRTAGATTFSERGEPVAPGAH